MLAEEMSTLFIFFLFLSSPPQVGPRASSRRVFHWRAGMPALQFPSQNVSSWSTDNTARPENTSPPPTVNYQLPVLCLCSYFFFLGSPPYEGRGVGVFADGVVLSFPE